MAYSTITNSEIAVGAPITNSLMIKMRDNPEAIATGASGATRIVYGALDLDNDITPSNMQGPTAGTSHLLRYVAEGEDQTQSASYPDSDAQTNAVHALVGGTITVHFQHYSWPAEETSDVRILKNGSTVATYSTTSLSYVTRTHNVPVSAGDVVDVQHKRRLSGTNPDDGGFLRLVRIYSNSESIAVA